MGERHLYSAVLLTVLVVVAVLGVYFVIDNQDLVKRQEAATQQELRRIEEEVRALRDATESSAAAQRAALDRIAKALAGVRLQAAPGNAGETPSPAIPEPPPAAGGAYANREFHDPQAESGGRRISYSSNFSGNLNPIVNNEALTSDIFNTCVDALAERHLVDVRRFEPLLAESWTRSADGLTYTIRLRRGATWHPYTDPQTGANVPAREVTADDFLFFWEVIRNPKIPCEALRNYYEDVERMEAAGPYELRVVWKQPYSLADEFTLGMQPLPRHYYRPGAEGMDDDAFAEAFASSVRNQHIVGCGPYRLVRWDKGTEVVMERYEGYYGIKPPIRQLVIKHIREPEKALLELKNGNLDRMGLLPHQWVTETRAPEFLVATPDPNRAVEDAAAFDARKTAGDVPADYTWEKYQYPVFTWFYIGYNLRRALFQDRRVRVALTHLVDRERILRQVYHGFGRVISGPFAAISLYYDPAVEPYPFDIERGKALLAEAGWTDTDNDGWLDKDVDGDGQRDRFEFAFMAIANHPLQSKYVPIIQEDMKKAGVKFEIKQAEWSVYLEALNEWKYDVCTLGWGGGFESDPYQIWHSSQARIKQSSNHVGYVSAEADRLIEAGRRCLDVDERIQIYHRFHRLLHEDQPYTFLVSPTSLVAQHRRYRNVRVWKSGMKTTLHWVPRAMQRVP